MVELEHAGVPELVRAWVAGWTVSRGTPSAVEEPWGLRVDVGLPDHVVRHVLPDADEVTVRKVAGTVTAPGTWLKAFVEPELMAGWLGAGWTNDAPGFLMATELRRGTPRTPDGYTLTSDTTAGVTRIRVLAADGSLAARGQCAPVGGVSVVDQIETAAGHRRRGLGSLVMGALADAALDRGAGTGLLGGSTEGRALYETLGWRTHAPLASFVNRPAAGPAAD